MYTSKTKLKSLELKLGIKWILGGPRMHFWVWESICLWQKFRIKKEFAGCGQRIHPYSERNGYMILIIVLIECTHWPWEVQFDLNFYLSLYFPEDLTLESDSCFGKFNMCLFSKTCQRSRHDQFIALITLSSFLHLPGHLLISGQELRWNMMGGAVPSAQVRKGGEDWDEGRFLVDKTQQCLSNQFP